MERKFQLLPEIVQVSLEHGETPADIVPVLSDAARIARSRDFKALLIVSGFGDPATAEAVCAAIEEIHSLGTPRAEDRFRRVHAPAIQRVSLRGALRAKVRDGRQGARFRARREGLARRARRPAPEPAQGSARAAVDALSPLPDGVARPPRPPGRVHGAGRREFNLSWPERAGHTRHPMLRTRAPPSVHPAIRSKGVPMKNKLLRPFLLSVTSVLLAAPLGSCAFADERSGEGPGDAQASKKQLPENDRKISEHAQR